MMLFYPDLVDIAALGTQPGLWTATRLVTDGQLKVTEKTLAGHTE